MKLRQVADLICDGDVDRLIYLIEDNYDFDQRLIEEDYEWSSKDVERLKDYVNQKRTDPNYIGRITWVVVGTDPETGEYVGTVEVWSWEGFDNNDPNNPNNYEWVDSPDGYYGEFQRRTQDQWRELVSDLLAKGYHFVDYDILGTDIESVTAYPLYGIKEVVCDKCGWFCEFAEDTPDFVFDLRGRIIDHTTLCSKCYKETNRKEKE